jgi:hypothetical protein
MKRTPTFSWTQELSNIVELRRQIKMDVRVVYDIAWRIQKWDCVEKAGLTEYVKKLNKNQWASREERLAVLETLEKLVRENVYPS